jgi:hypothetical protein
MQARCRLFRVKGYEHTLVQLKYVERQKNVITFLINLVMEGIFCDDRKVKSKAMHVRGGEGP